MRWWKKCKELARSLFSKEIGDNEGKEVRKRRRRLLKARWTLGNMGKWYLFWSMFGQSLVEFNAASENAQNRSGQKIGMQGGTKVNASGWSKRFK